MSTKETCMDSTTSAPFDTTVNGKKSDSSVSAVLSDSSISAVLSDNSNTNVMRHEVWIERWVKDLSSNHGHYEPDYTAMNKLV